MEVYIDEALKQGYNEPSTSPAAAGFFFVEKRGGGGLWPCIDYWGLNKVTVQYPHREMSGKPHLLLPMAVTNIESATSIFQCLINYVLHEFIGKCVVAYIDDILIYSASKSEHRYCQVLKKLWENHLYVKGEKCEFHVNKVAFLGYIINAEGVEMSMEKIKAVQEWPIPHTIKELQHFLGFANFYRHFIRGFSTVAGPLTSLLKGGRKKLMWTSEADRAFQLLKRSFTAAPILQHSDPNKPFIVDVDASNTGVGAILSQRVGDKHTFRTNYHRQRRIKTSVSENY